MQNRRKNEREGRKAEARVAAYIRLRGYKILAERFKTPYGEVDLIAQKGKTLAFVEVKQRASQRAIDESMNWRSEQRIIDSAEIWIEKNFAQLPRNFEIRFDFASIIGPVSPLCYVTYLKGAFRPD